MPVRSRTSSTPPRTRPRRDRGRRAAADRCPSGRRSARWRPIHRARPRRSTRAARGRGGAGRGGPRDPEAGSLGDESGGSRRWCRPRRRRRRRSRRDGGRGSGSSGRRPRPGRHRTDPDRRRRGWRPAIPTGATSSPPTAISSGSAGGTVQRSGGSGAPASASAAPVPSPSSPSSPSPSPPSPPSSSARDSSVNTHGWPRSKRKATSTIPSFGRRKNPSAPRGSTLARESSIRIAAAGAVSNAQTAPTPAGRTRRSPCGTRPGPPDGSRAALRLTS